MTSTQLQNRNPAPATTNRAIRHLKQAIASGRHWYIALLEAIKLWSAAEETHNGHTYQYLIDGEAFDWLLLCERLCLEVDGLLPDDEKTALLFEGRPPLKLKAEEFKGLIGTDKYQQYLNYFYGVTVEEALILAVTEEVRKERQTLGANGEGKINDEAFRRIYGLTRLELLRHFRQERGRRQSNSISLNELKEFTYWLFKYRLKNSDKARVASDTKKALAHLNNATPPLSRRLT